MKHLSFFLVLIIGTVTIFSTSSCNKDGENLSESRNNTGITAFPYTINLKADQWVKDVNGAFVNIFQDILASVYTGSNSSRTVRCYLVTERGDTPINSFIAFMGGGLWASNTLTDVKVYYYCSCNQLPFTSLNIKVVVE